MKEISRDICLQLIGQSVLLKNSYLSNNSHTELLAESSLRFPIVECLERRMGVQEIKLEWPHPFFKNRRIDLFWSIEKEKSVIELKYIKSGFRDKDNIQRVIDDIFRLLYSNLEGFHSYLMICGRSDDFNGELRNIRPRPDSVSSVLCPSSEMYASPYSNFLSFELSSAEKVFEIVNPEDGLYKDFCSRYNCRECKSLCDKLKGSSRLVYLSQNKDNALTHIVAVWEIKHID